MKRFEVDEKVCFCKSRLYHFLTSVFHKILIAETFETLGLEPALLVAFVPEFSVSISLFHFHKISAVFCLVAAIRSDRTRGGRSMYPGSRYLRQIATRVGPRTSGGNSLDGNEQNMLIGNRSVLDESDQLACAFIGLSGAHSFGPDGLPSSMDAGGGVYLDPAVLGTHGDDDDDDGEEVDHSGIDQSLLDYSGTLGSTGLASSNVSGAVATSTPYVGRQVVLNTGSDNSVRPRTELPKVMPIQVVWNSLNSTDFVIFHLGFNRTLSILVCDLH